MTGVGYVEESLGRGYYVNDCHGHADRYFDYDAYRDNIAWLYIHP